MRLEHGPSEFSKMMHGLVDAARQVQQEEQSVLPLTSQDVQMLEAMGIKVDEPVSRGRLRLEEFWAEDR